MSKSTGRTKKVRAKSEKNAVRDPDREIREWGVGLQNILVYKFGLKIRGTSPLDTPLK